MVVVRCGECLAQLDEGLRGVQAFHDRLDEHEPVAVAPDRLKRGRGHSPTLGATHGTQKGHVSAWGETCPLSSRVPSWRSRDNGTHDSGTRPPPPPPPPPPASSGQGRVRASVSVLTTLARALRLDDDQRKYLYELAGRTDEWPRRRRRVAQRVRPTMRRLLDQLTAAPAIVLGRRMDILAWNVAAAALFTDFSLMPSGRRNYVRLLFTDPIVRDMHQEWRHDARDAVAALRMAAAADPDDPELAQLVGELSFGDADFRTWWAEHRVNSDSYGTKHYRHRLVGDLRLDCDIWSSPDGPGQRLMVLTAEPGSASHDALRVLTSWTADQR